jgi:Cytochrome P460
MIRDSLDGISSNRSANNRHAQRLPLVALVVATSLAAAMACGTDDTDAPETDSNALQPGAPVTIAPRELPAEPEPVAAMPAPAAAPMLGAPGAATPNGLSIPPGVQDWRVIGVAAPGGDTGTLRVIVGNRTAVAAARAGNTNPWPEGSMLSHLSWKSSQNPDDAATRGPGDFDRLTLMVKNTQLYADNGGWAYGVWMGAELRPPATAGFDQACVNCHTSNVADKDFVFTDPGQLPSDTDIAAAAKAPNGLDVPAGILDWRVIGVANVSGDNPTIRVIVGNDTAVAAARAGRTNPWPDGTMLSHYNWAAGTNPDEANTVAPGGFNAFTLMVRNSNAYTTSGGWAYGVWPSLSLVPLAAGFDQGCINCHTDTVKDNDYVFTRPGVLPAALLGTPAAQ